MQRELRKKVVLSNREKLYILALVTRHIYFLFLLSILLYFSTMEMIYVYYAIMYGDL